MTTNGSPCESIAENVKELMKNEFLQKRKGHWMKDLGELDDTIPEKRNRCHQTKTGNQSGDEFTLTIGSGSTNRVNMESLSENSSWSTNHVNMESLSEDGEEYSVPFPNRCLNFQEAVRETEDTSLRWGNRSIGRFFYETGLEFNADMIDSFYRMMDSLTDGKIVHMIPSNKELKGWVLEDELKDIQCYMKEIKSSWVRTGCSILFDGWTDKQGRELINVLVDGPKGAIYLRSVDISASVGDINSMDSFLDEVLTEIGVNNIAQVITNSTSVCMQSLGARLMEKYRSVFWTVSASHCIEMILKEIGNLDLIKETLGKAKKITKFIYNHVSLIKLMKNHTYGRDLIRSSKFKSASTFVTLQNILSEEASLKKMFSSSDWNDSTWASSEYGRSVADLVADFSFWNDATKVLKATIPLVHVLKLIIEGDNQQIGYIYEMIDQAKKTIKEEFKSDVSQYSPLWEVINNIWENCLNNPLHSAGYLLNPSMFYSTDFSPGQKVINDLLCCIVRMAEDKQVQDLITLQLAAFREAKGTFGHESAIKNRSKMSPALWWSSYGEECPELQKFAVRILSQTCIGSSRYALNKSLAEKLLNLGEANKLERLKLCDLTFIHYNIRLRQFEHGVVRSILDDEIDPTDDWLLDKTQKLMFPEDDLTWMDLYS